jgi:hypothetical protein
MRNRPNRIKLAAISAAVACLGGGLGLALGTSGAGAQSPSTTSTTTSTTTTKPPVDTTVNFKLLLGKHKQKFNGFVRVKVKCGEPCVLGATGRMSVTVAAGGKSLLRAQRFKLRKTKGFVAIAGQTTVLKLKIPAKAKAALRKVRRSGGHATATVVVTATDIVGNTGKKHGRVRLARRH